MTDEKTPRLPIDLSTYNVRDLKAITGDQLWFCALLVELRSMGDKLDKLIELQTRKTK